MKKQSMFKAILIAILSVALLTWLIPTGTVSGTEVIADGLTRIGLFELIKYPIVSFQYFGNIVLFIFGVGAFYGLLTKSGKYSLAINKIVKSLKGKEKFLLVGITVFFAVLTAVCGFNLAAFALIPLFITLLIAVGFNRMSAFLATFGATIIGVVGSLYNPGVNTFINSVTQVTEYNTDILVKVIFLVVTLGVYIYFMFKYASDIKKNIAKNKIEEENKDVFELAERSKKGSTGVIAILSIMIIVLIVAVFPWSKVWGIEFFANMTDSILKWEFGGHALFGYLFGNVTAFGSWAYEEILVLLAITAIIIASMSKMKFDDILDGLFSGVKKMVRPVIAVSLAYTVLVLAVYYPFFTTIEGWIIGLVADFNVLAIVTSSLTTILGGTLYIDIMYSTQQVLPFMIGVYPESSNIIALIFQSMTGLTMLIAPTSALLILGLEYLEIPYTTWIKFIWKLVLTLFIIVLIILIISLFIL